ncbi:MAG: ABC transporter ATP-binding protein [Gloeomargarita sp. SKYG116]|nr:ABC transporter ATP-binding protein [Gloeomargarita sp. SKYG116]MDW8400433.1 ABC transporter ATP-binding protein [Gloeomargarita sp. SKYGB_i_bin116]
MARETTLTTGIDQLLVSVRGLWVAYPQGDWVLRAIDLDLAPGERLGLVGESGSGKSTLGRALIRLLPPGSRVQGHLQIAGVDVATLSAQQLRHLRGELVGFVFQDPMTRLNPLMTVGEHVRETLRAHRRVGAKQAEAEGLAMLEAVQLPRRCWGQYPHQLSGGMRQRVGIALALLLRPRLVIADEPTTALDVTVAREILELLVRLAPGLILISHDLHWVRRYCQRVAVMHRGEIVEQGDADAVLNRPQHPYTQALRDAAITHSWTIPPLPDQSPCLTLRHIGHEYPLPPRHLGQVLGLQPPPRLRVLDGIDLEVRPGETLGLVGESGSGKSTCARVILKLLQPTQGCVYWQGQELTSLSLRQFRPYRRQLQIIFQDPRACLNPLLTVEQILQEPLRVHRLAQGRKARQLLVEALAQVGLPVDLLLRYPHQLSGGQQQRVAIARALLVRPQVLVCDEPVSMLDAQVQVQILELLARLRQELGLTLLFITHDLRVARQFCHTVAVLQQGRIVEYGPARDVLTHPQHPYTQALLAASGL